MRLHILALGVTVGMMLTMGLLLVVEGCAREGPTNMDRLQGTRRST